MEVINAAFVFDLAGQRHELPATPLTNAMEKLNHLAQQHSVDFGIEEIFSLSQKPENNLCKLKHATFYYCPQLHDIYYSKSIPTFELSTDLLKVYHSIVGPVLRLITRKRTAPECDVQCLEDSEDEDAFASNEPPKWLEEEKVGVVVQQMAGKRFEVQIPKSGGMLVSEFKAEIHKLQGFPVAHQNLIGAGKRLIDTNTLAESGITQGSVIYAVLESKATGQPLVGFGQIIVKTLSGKKLVLDVEASNTIGTIKRQIQDKEGIPCDEQHLAFAGKQLEDHKTLAECDIRKKSVIYMVLNLKGGMYHVASGYDDVTGEFLYTLVNFNGTKLAIHPGWTSQELKMHVAEAFASERPLEVMCSKFQKTALALYAKELAERDRALYDRLHVLQGRKK